MSDTSTVCINPNRGRGLSGIQRNFFPDLRIEIDTYLDEEDLNLDYFMFINKCFEI